MLAFNLQDVFRKSFFTLLFFLPVLVWSQSYPLGINPPYLNWRSLTTEKVNVVYPEELESKAQYVANLVHLLWDSSYYSLGPRHERVSIILQNQNTTSNGFVTVSPFRSEFYLTPPQYSFLGNVDWLTGLTIHEYRHVEQFVNAKKSITRLGSILFGQNGWGLTAGLALPRWFFEGDAVFYETALSQGGRGRMPEFENEYKALLLERDKAPKYEQASAGSYKHFIPNHYTLGYYMTTGMRRDFGNDTLEKVVDRAVSYQSILFPFSLGLKKLTGYRTPQYYKKLIADLESEWHSEDSLISYQTGNLIHTENKTFTNYSNPVFINDSTLVCFKSGYRDILKVVSIDMKTGTEKKIFEPGFISRSNLSLSTNGRYLIWAQAAFHPRWELLDYSEIWAYDLKSQNLLRLTDKTRYFTPAIEPRGSRIAAIENQTDQTERLVVINSGTGTVESAFQFENGVRGGFPVWGPDGLVYFILQKPAHNALAVFNPVDQSIQQLSPDWRGVIGYPTVSNDEIYFNATFTGTNNIYKWNLNQNQLFQVTNSRFGAVNPSIHPTTGILISADYSNSGYHLKSFDPLTNEAISLESISNSADFFKPMISSPAIVLEMPVDTFSTKPLKATKGLFNLHSWTPWFFPPNFGLIIEADNIMSTFSTEASATYNTNEMATTFGVSSKYGGWFSVFELDLSRGNRNRYVPVIFEENENLGLNIETQRWLEDDISLGITLPLNTTWKNYFSNITLSQKIHKKWVNYESTALDQVIGVNENFEAYSLDFSGYFLRRRAIQQVTSRFGLTSNLKYRTTIGTAFNQANYFQTISRVYLPGLGRNHGFYATFGFQSESFLSSYKFRDDFFYTRGYGAIPHDKTTNIGFNYSLPLLYPDIPIGPFFFIQRIKANLFFDTGRITLENHRLTDYNKKGDITLDLSNRNTNRTVNSIQSYGAELTFDVRVLRSLDIDTGFRVSVPLNASYSNKKVVFEYLLFSLNI